MLKVNEVKEIIENEELETRESAIEYFENNEEEVTRKGWNLIMKMKNENDLEYIDLLFGSAMYPYGSPTISIGNNRKTNFCPDNERETVRIGGIEMTGSDNNRPDVARVKAGNFDLKFNIFPPRDGDLLPGIQIPGRNVNNPREIDADTILKIWNDKGAGAAKNYLESKGKSYNNGTENVDINIYHDIEVNIDSRDSFVSAIDEIGAIAGMIWMIKKWGVPRYISTLYRHQEEKNDGDNSWTCSSCRYCKKREITVKNEKDLTETDNIYVCSLTDVTIGSEYSDCWDGLFEEIAVQFPEGRKIMSCPYNDKNYKSKNLDDWVTEKPKPFFPVIRFGADLFVLLDGIAVDVSILQKNIEIFNALREKERKKENKKKETNSGSSKNEEEIARTGGSKSAAVSSKTKKVEVTDGIKKQLSEEELETFRASASLKGDLPDNKAELKEILETALKSAQDIGDYRASVIAIQLAESSPFSTADELLRALKEAGDVGPARFSYIKKAFQKENILSLVANTEGSEN